MSAFPGKITCRFHVTQQSSPICEELQPHVTGTHHGTVLISQVLSLITSLRRKLNTTRSSVHLPTSVSIFKDSK